MASLSKYGDSWRVTFDDAERKRRTLRLGKASKKVAESIKLRVEDLIACAFGGTAPSPDLAKWTREIDDKLHDRLARVDLVEPRKQLRRYTIAAAYKAFLEAQSRSKPATITKLEQARDHVLDHFGDVPMASITKATAEGWRVMMDAKFAQATVARRVRVVRQFWAWCVDNELCHDNPWKRVKAGSERNPDRIHFVDRPTIEKVLDVCPSMQWRLFLSLLRFGGMRCGEALALRWEDVNFDKRRLWVRSEKTKHHAGGEGRWLPMFPELEPLLVEAFGEAEDGPDRVLSEFRQDYNPHTHTRRLIKRAGVKEWPKVLHNLRASRQVELCEEHPLHAVCAWLGNSTTVAMNHYLRVRDLDFDKATGGPVGEPEKAARNAARKPSAKAGKGRKSVPDSVPLSALGAQKPRLRGSEGGSKWAILGSNQ